MDPKIDQKMDNSQPVLNTEHKKEESKYRGVKLVVLGLLNIITIVVTVYAFDLFLSAANPNHLALSLGVGGLFLVLAILTSVFIETRSLIFAFAFLESLAAASLFMGKLGEGNPMPFVLGALTLFLFLASGMREGHRLREDSLKIHFGWISKSVLPKAATGLLIFLSVLLYMNYFEWGKFNDEAGERLTSALLKSSEQTVKIWYPGFSFNLPTGELLDLVAEEQLKKLTPDLVESSLGDFELNYSNLPAQIKQKMLGEASARLKTSLEGFIGPVDEKTAANKAVYLAIKEYLNKFSEKSKVVFGVVVAAAAFWVLRGIAALFHWLIRVIALLIFKFLIAIGFAVMKWEPRNKETVVL